MPWEESCWHSWLAAISYLDFKTGQVREISSQTKPKTSIETSPSRGRYFLVSVPRLSAGTYIYSLLDVCRVESPLVFGAGRSLRTLT